MLQCGVDQSALSHGTRPLAKVQRARGLLALAKPLTPDFGNPIVDRRLGGAEPFRPLEPLGVYGHSPPKPTEPHRAIGICWSAMDRLAVQGVQGARGAPRDRSAGRALQPASHRPATKAHKNSRRHSITLSARASSVGGTVRPSALAVFRLIPRLNLVGISTGRSATLAPLRRRPAYMPARRCISVAPGT